MFWEVPVTNGDLTAEATVTVLDFAGQGNANGGDTIDLKINLKNTTSPLLNESVMSFGFNVMPDEPLEVSYFDEVLSEGEIADADDTTWSVKEDANFAGGFQKVDICIFNPQNCNGGTILAGLAAGEEDTLLLSLTGQFSSMVANPDNNVQLEKGMMIKG